MHDTKSVALYVGKKVRQKVYSSVYIWSFTAGIKKMHTQSLWTVDFKVHVIPMEVEY